MAISSHRFASVGGGPKERQTGCGCGYRTVGPSSFLSLKASPPAIVGDSGNKTENDRDWYSQLSRPLSSTVKLQLGPGSLGIAILGKGLQPSERYSDRKSLKCPHEILINSVKEATREELGKWSVLFRNSDEDVQPAAPCTSPALSYRSPRVNTEKQKDDFSKTAADNSRNAQDVKSPKQVKLLIPDANGHDSESDQYDPDSDFEEYRPVNSVPTVRIVEKNVLADTKTQDTDTVIVDIEKQVHVPCSTATGYAVKGKTIEFLSKENIDYSGSSLGQKVVDTLLLMEYIQDRGARYDKDVVIGDQIVQNFKGKCRIGCDKLVDQVDKNKQTVFHPPEMIVTQTQLGPRPCTQTNFVSRKIRPTSGGRKSLIRGKSNTRGGVSASKSAQEVAICNRTCDTRVIKDQALSKNDYDLTAVRNMHDKYLSCTRSESPLIWERITGSTDKQINTSGSSSPEIVDELRLLSSVKNISISVEEKESNKKLSEGTTSILSQPSTTRGSRTGHRVTWLEDNVDAENKSLVGGTRKLELVPLTRDNIVDQKSAKDDSTEGLSQSNNDTNLRPTTLVRMACKEHRKKARDANQKQPNAKTNIKTRSRPKSSHPRLQSSPAVLKTESVKLDQFSKFRAKKAWDSELESPIGRRTKSADQVTRSESQPLLKAKKCTSAKRDDTKDKTIDRRSSLSTFSKSTKHSDKKKQGCNKRRPISAPVGKQIVDLRMQAEDAPSQECEDIFSKCQDKGIRLSMKTLCRALMPPSEDHREESYTRLPTSSTGLLSRPENWFR